MFALVQSNVAKGTNSGGTNMAPQSHPLWLGAILRDIGVMLTTTQRVNAPDLSTVEISVVTKSKSKRVWLRFPLVQSREDGFGGKEWTTI